MCIIVLKPAGRELPSDDIFRKCFNANRDGSGIAISRPDEGIVHVRKGYMSWNDFYSAYQALKIRKEDAAMFHFRLATSGGTNPENCHPFPIYYEHDKKEALKLTSYRAPIVVTHNGVLSEFSDYKSAYSDTQEFIHKVLNRIPLKPSKQSYGLMDKMMRQRIEGIIGTYNKLAFLMGNGTFFILNENAGTWQDGIWYSNTHSFYTTTTQGYNTCDWDGMGGYGYNYGLLNRNTTKYPVVHVSEAVYCQDCKAPLVDEKSKKARRCYTCRENYNKFLLDEFSKDDSESPETTASHNDNEFDL